MCREPCCHELPRQKNATRLKVHDHCNLRALIGRKGGDRPSSLHTQRWRPKGPKKTSWIKSLHEVLHGGLWIRFHGLPEFSSGFTSKEVALTQISGDHDFFNLFFSMTYFRAYLIIDSRTCKCHQVVLSNW